MGLIIFLQVQVARAYGCPDSLSPAVIEEYNKLEREYNAMLEEQLGKREKIGSEY